MGRWGSPGARRPVLWRVRVLASASGLLNRWPPVRGTVVRFQLSPLWKVWTNGRPPGLENRDVGREVGGGSNPLLSAYKTSHCVTRGSSASLRPRRAHGGPIARTAWGGRMTPSAPNNPVSNRRCRVAVNHPSTDMGGSTPPAGTACRPTAQSRGGLWIEGRQAQAAFD